MTFFSESADMTDLVAALRSDLPPVYESNPGFRGLVVLVKPDVRNHVIALTLWEDDDALAGSEAIADGFADRIAAATGTAVARNVYDVLGTIGIVERAPATEP